MFEAIPANSIGLVTPQSMTFQELPLLNCGTTLPEYTHVCETCGKLYASRSNAILICHAPCSHLHASGHYPVDDLESGWRDACAGPGGKPLDTESFFAVCSNNLGGCHGSTGPASINPATGKPLGKYFRGIVVRDRVRSQVCPAPRTI